MNLNFPEKILAFLDEKNPKIEVYQQVVFAIMRYMQKSPLDSSLLSAEARTLYNEALKILNPIMRRREYARKYRERKKAEKAAQKPAQKPTDTPKTTPEPPQKTAETAPQAAEPPRTYQKWPSTPEEIEAYHRRCLWFAGGY